MAEGSAPRAFWSGTLAFGLVTVPVDLLPAVRSSRGSLRMLAPDGTPLVRRYACPAEDRLLDPSEIVRGYEVDDGAFVLLTDEELDALEPQKSREIDLRRFVPVDAIDPAFFDRPYVLAPSGESSKAYRLLAQAMEEADRAGIGTFVMRGTEHLAAILSEGGILRIETLRFSEELRSAKDVGLGELPGPDPGEVDRIAGAIDDLEADDVDPAELEDIRADRLEALVERKLESGEDVVEVDREAAAASAAEDATIVDLMEVLKRRLKGGDRAPPARSDLEERTKDELYAMAREREIGGRSTMTKAELVEALSAD